MWDDVEPGNDSPSDMSWVAEGLTLGALIWAADGSYDRKRVSDLSGEGWIIFCKRMGFCITDSFWERLISATLYRAKLLGLCALHFLARPVAEFYKLGGWTAMLCCNNKLALEKSSNTTGAGSDPVQSAWTYVVASERQSHCSEDRSAMSMSCLRTYGQTPHLGPATQLCLRYTGKEVYHIGAFPRISQ